MFFAQPKGLTSARGVPNLFQARFMRSNRFTDTTFCKFTRASSMFLMSWVFGSYHVYDEHTPGIYFLRNLYRDFF